MHAPEYTVVPKYHIDALQSSIQVHPFMKIHPVRSGKTSCKGALTQRTKRTTDKVRKTWSEEKTAWSLGGNGHGMFKYHHLYPRCFFDAS